MLLLLEMNAKIPAMVNSNVCLIYLVYIFFVNLLLNCNLIVGDVCESVSAESGFGRSLFDRLSCLGHFKHLLNVQYRMHPSISFFPNWRFYQNQILDGENVIRGSHGKRFLSGPMFGSYSFINVVGGREEKNDDGKSRRNMVECGLTRRGSLLLVLYLLMLHKLHLFKKNLLASMRNLMDFQSFLMKLVQPYRLFITFVISTKLTFVIHSFLQFKQAMMQSLFIFPWRYAGLLVVNVIF